MIKLFKKHQRILLIVTSGLTISSFVFFGANGVMQSSQDSDPVVACAIDGSEILRSDLLMMVHFLQEDPLLNDRFLAQDFFTTGIATMLFERHKEELSEELQGSLAKARYFRPYVHPHAEELSQEAIWKQFHPQLLSNYEKIHNLESSSEQSFDLLTQLYLQQERFSPELVRQIIGFQQQRFKQIPPDTYLQQRDLNLFGFHTIEDWVGRKFLELTAEFVINTAIVAESKGHRVSYEEALADLVFRIKEAKHASYKEAGELLVTLSERSGLGYSRAINMWQKILLFRRLFHEVGNSVFVDPLMAAHFSSYAKESMQLDLYKLPEALQLQIFSDLLKFQFYVEAVSGLTAQTVELPRLALSPAVVERKYPELVQRKFVIDLASVTEDEVGVNFALEETWEWELAEQNFNVLRKKYPEISPAVTREERFLALEELDPIQRQAVDQTARNEMVKGNKEMLFNVLQAKPLKRLELAVRSKGEEPLFGTISSQFFLSLVEKKEGLDCFTVDEKTYYRMEIRDGSGVKEILSFDDSSRDGILDPLVDRFLNEAYASVRKNDSAPFKAASGWKPFEEVKEEIGKRVYAKLLRSLGDGSNLDLAAQRRFVPYLQKVLAEIRHNPESAVLYTHSALESDPLRRQLSLVHGVEDVTRGVGFAGNKEKLFERQEGDFSEIEGERGRLFFYQVKKREKESSSEQRNLSENETLSIDARRSLMHDLLEKNCARRA